MIRVIHPESGSRSRIRILTFYPSRIPESKRHRIPDPQHCCYILQIRIPKSRVRIHIQINERRLNVDSCGPGSEPTTMMLETTLKRRRCFLFVGRTLADESCLKKFCHTRISAGRNHVRDHISKFKNFMILPR
jgi:hypothetical protein